MSRPKFGVITEETPEKAILVGIDRGDPDWPLEESLAELERLAHTDGVEVVYSVSQRLDSPNPRTFIGQGKAEEIKTLVSNLAADVVIFDDELSPSQQNNLEKLFGAPVKVIDRTALILDIFALHATSREGSLQVKLAQNQYLYPRLRGMWGHLASNRMGGGVGSRFGEGESQLEVDRRLVRKRIGKIRGELKELETNRRNQRKHRNQSGVFRIALAGYTNAGKSTLMNAVTDAGVLADDMLFATLDSTTRKIGLPDGTSATITDTVGFIQKLPHGLVEAFHSTLDEIREADLILIVVDASSPQRDAQLASVQETLADIVTKNVPQIIVFNKMDLIETESEKKRLRDLFADAQFISALDREGISLLLNKISEKANERMRRLEVLIPYSEGKLVEEAHVYGVIEHEEYLHNGTKLTMKVPSDRAARFSSYSVDTD